MSLQYCEEYEIEFERFAMLCDRVYQDDDVRRCDLPENKITKTCEPATCCLCYPAEPGENHEMATVRVDKFEVADE